MVVRFSPKSLGLNARIFGTVSRQFETEISGLFLDSPELNFRDCFGQSGTEITGLFWVVPRLIFGLLLVHVCCFNVLLLKKKLNSMLVV